MLCLSLSDIGLILDIIAILLLAKFSVPTNTLSPDGTSTLSLNTGKENTANNKNKYYYYRKITITSYIILCIGFLLQLRIIQQLLQ